MVNRTIDRERIINMVNSLISWKLITEKQREQIIRTYDKKYGEVSANSSQQ